MFSIFTKLLCKYLGTMYCSESVPYSKRTRKSHPSQNVQTFALLKGFWVQLLLHNFVWFELPFYEQHRAQKRKRNRKEKMMVCHQLPNGAPVLTTLLFFMIGPNTLLWKVGTWILIIQRMETILYKMISLVPDFVS